MLKTTPLVFILSEKVEKWIFASPLQVTKELDERERDARELEAALLSIQNEVEALENKVGHQARVSIEAWFSMSMLMPMPVLLVVCCCY